MFPTFAAIRSGRPVRLAISIASMMPFSGSTRPTKQKDSPGCSANGAPSRVRPLWMIVQGTSGWVLGLVPADRDHAVRCVLEQPIRPGQVEPAVERGDDRDRRHAGERHRPPLEMRVDDVELGRLLDDLLDRRGEPAAGVALDPRRSERLLDGRHEPARDVGVAAREDGDVVAAPDELGRQLVDDPLGPAVRRRRHALQRRGDLRDAQGSRGGVHPGRCRSRGWSITVHRLRRLAPRTRIQRPWRGLAPAYRAPGPIGANDRGPGAL